MAQMAQPGLFKSAVWGGLSVLLTFVFTSTYVAILLNYTTEVPELNWSEYACLIGLGFIFASALLASWLFKEKEKQDE